MSPVWGMAAIWKCPQTPARNIRRQCEALLGQWIKTAWNDVSSEAMVEGFKSDINRTENDVLWEEDHEENPTSTDRSVGYD
jgi:hypothetical protein